MLFFSFSKPFFKDCFLVLPCCSNDLENFAENVLHLAIDQLPVCQIQPSVNSGLRNGFF